MFGFVVFFLSPQSATVNWEILSVIPPIVPSFFPLANRAAWKSGVPWQPVCSAWWQAVLLTSNRAAGRGRLKQGWGHNSKTFFHFRTSLEKCPVFETESPNKINWSADRTTKTARSE